MITQNFVEWRDHYGPALWSIYEDVQKIRDVDFNRFAYIIFCKSSGELVDY